MKASSKFATVGATLALGLTPALAVGAPGNSASHAGPKAKGHHTATPGPKASMPAMAKAYGRYCRGQSKQHVKGQKGTPFSNCVTDMAKLAKGTTTSPRKACRDESKKHVKGHKGTPFSRCVSGGAKLKHDQKHPGDQYTDPFGS